MTEFLNAYSGWLSLVALILSIPLGIVANLAAPKFQIWYASRSSRALRNRIHLLETQVEQTDRLVSETSYAIAQFAYKGFFAVVGWITALAVFLFLSMTVLGVEIVAALSSDLPEPLQVLYGSGSPTVIKLTFVLGVIAGSTSAFLISRPTFVLLRMANRVTAHKKWKEKTLLEIQELKNRIS